MKIIIAGMGLTGELAAVQACREGHDVVVIDTDQKRIDMITDRYSVSGVCGSCSAREILQKAGADTADVVVAAASVDEVNVLCCRTAKDIGARYTAALLRDVPLYQDREYLKEEYRIDYIVNPKYETAASIGRQLGLPTDVKAYGFIEQKAAILSVSIEEGSLLDGIELTKIREILGERILLGTVRRKDTLYVPDGRFILRAEDEVGIIAPNEEILEIARKLGHVRKPVKNVLIIGCGMIGSYLVERLLKRKKHIKILDNSLTRCEALRAELPPEVDICYADEINAEVLVEEGIRDADTCILLTGSDEMNLILSMFAWSCGIGSIITKINTPSYEDVLNKVSIHITVTPASVTCDKLMTFIRNVEVFNDKGNDIYSMFSLAGGLGKAMGFIAYKDSKGINMLFRSAEFHLKKDVLIAAIIRDQEFIIPDGNSEILPGDRVIAVAKADQVFCKLDDIFA